MGMTKSKPAMLRIAIAGTLVCLTVAGAEASMTLPRARGGQVRLLPARVVLLTPCGEVPGGVRLEYAVDGDYLYVLEGDTLHRYTGESIAARWVWERSCFLSSLDVDKHRASPAEMKKDIFITRLEVRGNSVTVHREGMVDICDFTPPFRGYARRNVAELRAAFEREQKLRAHAMGLLPYIGAAIESSSAATH